MHAQEMLFHVIGPIELLQADIAMEWFLLLVDVLVPREQIAAIR